MAKKQTAGRDRLGKLAPKFADWWMSLPSPLCPEAFSFAAGLVDLCLNHEIYGRIPLPPNHKTAQAA